jgi:hypothetical protein
MLHAASHRYYIHETDVKTAFLIGGLSENVYVVHPPEGMVPAGKVQRLEEALWFESGSKSVAC